MIAGPVDVTVEAATAIAGRADLVPISPAPKALRRPAANSARAMNIAIVKADATKATDPRAKGSRRAKDNAPAADADAINSKDTDAARADAIHNGRKARVDARTTINAVLIKATVSRAHRKAVARITRADRNRERRSLRPGSGKKFPDSSRNCSGRSRLNGRPGSWRASRARPYRKPS